MSFCTIEDVKSELNITGTASDDNLLLWIPIASAFLETEIGRKILLATYTEYYSGNGDPDLLTNQRPVQSVASINLDANGFYGKFSGGFDSTTLLISGDTYALIPDEPGQTWSRSGVIRWRAGGSLAFFDGGYPYLNPRNLLTRGAIKAGWPIGDGNIKVVYDAGWTAAQIPRDLKNCAIQIIDAMRKGIKSGNFVDAGKTIGPYSTRKGLLELSMRSVVGFRDVIRRYRELEF